jgi:AP-2 complex subunit sigma-1
VYRRYAGLYFLFCVDVTDNELLYLETIHLFVEVGSTASEGGLLCDSSKACCG